jgi:hypothetical protein
MMQKATFHTSKFKIFFKMTHPNDYGKAALQQYQRLQLQIKDFKTRVHWPRAHIPVLTSEK